MKKDSCSQTIGIKDFVFEAYLEILEFNRMQG